jgi:hypothetical protein
MADETEEQNKKDESFARELGGVFRQIREGATAKVVGDDEVVDYGSFRRVPTNQWFNWIPGTDKYKYEFDPISPQSMQTAEDYWQGELAEAKKANTYDEQFYREQRDLFSNLQMDTASKLAAWDRAIAGAYGAAGAQARRSGQNIYSAGQRAAGEVAGASDAAASRAAGYLSGQGMPSTTVSGLAGTSGGESFDPTMGRAYGGIQAETIGREAAYDAQELTARGSGMSAGRQNLLDAFMIQTDGLIAQLDSAAIAARAQGRGAERAATQAVKDRIKQDTLSPQNLSIIARRADEAWDSNEELRSRFKNRQEYDIAIQYLLEQKSRRAITEFWNLYTYGSDSIQPLLPPSAEESAAALAALTGQ